MKIFFLRLWRSLMDDYRCPICNCDRIPWRDGNWACPCCDLSPARECPNKGEWQ